MGESLEEEIDEYVKDKEKLINELEDDTSFAELKSALKASEIRIKELENEILLSKDTINLKSELEKTKSLLRESEDNCIKLKAAIRRQMHSPDASLNNSHMSGSQLMQEELDFHRKNNLKLKQQLQSKNEQYEQLL